MNVGLTFADRRSPMGFWLGSLSVVFGVLLRLPAFLMARAMDDRMAGRPMGMPMRIGRACILAGAAAAAYGMLPKPADPPASTPNGRIAAPEDAPLTVRH